MPRSTRQSAKRSIEEASDGEIIKGDQKRTAEPTTDSPDISTDAGETTDAGDKVAPLAPGKSGFYQFVSKNKTIPAIQANLMQTDLDKLTSAVGRADYEAEIFNHPHVIHMIQHLYENDIITEEQRATLMLHHTALQSFTDRQSWSGQEQHPADMPVKVVAVGDVQYEDVLDEYLKAVQEKLEAMCLESSVRIELNNIFRAKVKHAMRNFPCSERALITMELPEKLSDKDKIPETPPENKNDRVQFMTAKFCHREPFFFQVVLTDRKIAVIPSISLLNHLLVSVNPESVQRVMPVLGKLKPETMVVHFLRNHYRPMNIHCRDIKSNNESVHNVIYDPFNIALHDILHVVITNFALKKNVYKFIIEQWLPFLVLFKDKSCIDQFNQVELKQIDKLIEESADLHEMPKLHYGVGYCEELLLLDNVLLLACHFNAKDLPETLVPDSYEMNRLKIDLDECIQAMKDNIGQKSFSDWIVADVNWLIRMVDLKLNPDKAQSASYTPMHSASASSSSAAAAAVVTADEPVALSSSSSAFASVPRRSPSNYRN